MSIDKVVELTRFATPKTERKLITWARKVSVATIRARADELASKDRQDLKEKRHGRHLRYRHEEDNFWIDVLVPAAVGVPLFAALDKRAKELAPAPTDDEGRETGTLEQRRMDALVEAVHDAPSWVEGRSFTANEVFIHTRLHEQGFSNGTANGVVLSSDTIERLTCDARLRFVLTDADGNATGIGHASRKIPEWMRQVVLKEFEFTCCFPGCDHKRGLDVHHFSHWAYGGPTDPENLGPMCRPHHSLLHEHDWRAFKGSAGTVIWFRPDGTEYLPGPAPPPLLA